MRDKKKGVDFKLSPKTGRPKIENPKNQRFSIRLDTELGYKLDNFCKSCNMKRAEVIRLAIIQFLESYNK